MKTPKYISEIFSMVKDSNTIEEKMEILKKYDSNIVRQICRYAYDPKFSSLISTVPKYRVDDSPYGYSYSDLTKEYQRIPYFLDFSNKPASYTLNKGKMYRILQNIMERMHWAESAILEAILTRREVPNVSKELVEKTFPNLIPSGKLVSNEGNDE